MRSRLLPLFGLLLISSNAFATPAHLWSKHFGNYSIDLSDGIASDPNGGFAMTGQVITAVDFGGGLLYPVEGSSMYLAKYDDAGNHQWSKLFDEATVLDLVFDSSGNVIVAGYCGGDVNFGGGVMPGLAGTFLVKFDAGGNHVWSKRFPRNVWCPDVAVDALGNIVACGGFTGTYSFGGPPLTADFFDADTFIVTFNPNGAHIWSKKYGQNSRTGASHVALDAVGNIVIEGDCTIPFDFGGGSLAGPAGVFLAKFNSTGVHVWSERFGAPNNDTVEGFAVDGSDNVLMAGWFSGTANYGGAPLVAVGGNDVFLAKYAPSGLHMWSRSMGGPGDVDQAFGLAVDHLGNATIAGQYKPGAQFGGGVLPNAGGADLFVATYDAAGVHQWSAGFGTSEWDEGAAGVAVDGSGNVVVVGYYANAINFGGGPLQSFGFHDICLAKFGQLPVPVLIRNLSAAARNSAVDVSWDLSSDEALDAFTLYRTSDGSTRVIASGNASTRSYTDGSVEPGKRYEYELAITTANGDVFRSPIASVDMPALASSLEQNQPNPFNPSTTIAYALTERATTAVAIYDAAGSLVVRLDAGEHDAGPHSVTWNGRDASGRPVASGVYFYQLEGVAGVAARKMVLLK